MPIKKEAWAEGTPAWVDLMASDFEGSKAFYAGLFGWQYDEGGPEFGGYATARLNGAAVAGIGPAQGGDAPPSAWTTYLAADDAEATADRIAAAGGQVMMPAMTVGSYGTMAVVADSTGGVFGLWQSGDHQGVELYNEPGGLTWNEAMVGDYRAGMDFYAAVFGYTYTDIGQGMDYSTIELDGKPVAGIGSAALAGEGVPPHWRTYFAVADAAATCAKAAELGGHVVAEPWETTFGTMAAIGGPDGEMFCINQAPPERRAQSLSQ